MDDHDTIRCHPEGTLSRPRDGKKFSDASEGSSDRGRPTGMQHTLTKGAPMPKPNPSAPHRPDERAVFTDLLREHDRQMRALAYRMMG